MAKAALKKKKKTSGTDVTNSSPTPPAEPDPVSRSPYAPFEQEIIDRIIKPRIIAAIRSGGVDSIADLTRIWRETFSCRVSETTIRHWLDLSGLKFHRTVMVEGLDAVPASMDPAPEPLVLDPDTAPDHFFPTPPVGVG